MGHRDSWEQNRHPSGQPVLVLQAREKARLASCGRQWPGDGPRGGFFRDGRLWTVAVAMR
jgi:hypothetical protein